MQNTVEHLAVPLEEGEEMVGALDRATTPTVDLPEEKEYPALAQLVADGLLTDQEMLLILLGENI